MVLRDCGFGASDYELDIQYRIQFHGGLLWASSLLRLQRFLELLLRHGLATAEAKQN